MRYMARTTHRQLHETHGGRLVRSRCTSTSISLGPSVRREELLESERDEVLPGWRGHPACDGAPAGPGHIWWRRHRRYGSAPRCTHGPLQGKELARGCGLGWKLEGCCGFRGTPHGGDRTVARLSGVLQPASSARGTRSRFGRRFPADAALQTREDVVREATTFLHVV